MRLHRMSTSEEVRTARRSLRFIAGVLLACCCSAGSVQAEENVSGETVLASVDGRTITVDQFLTEIERRSASGSRDFSTLEAREALLDEMVKREIVVAHAIEEGFDRDPEFLAAVYRILISRYTEEHLNHRIEGLQVSDDEVRNAFESERATYRRPERRKAAVVFLEVKAGATPERTADLEARAEELRLLAAELDDVTHLGQLALENSDDRATRYTGGVLPWMIEGQRYKWGDEVVEALFALDEVGDVAPVVRTEKGFYVIRLAAREGSQELPYEMYEAGIRRRLLIEKQSVEREAFYRELESETEVTVNSEPLNRIPGLIENPDPDQDPRPPGLPGGASESDANEAEKVEQR